MVVLKMHRVFEVGASCALIGVVIEFDRHRDHWRTMGYRAIFTGETLARTMAKP